MVLLTWMAASPVAADHHCVFPMLAAMKRARIEGASPPSEPRDEELPGELLMEKHTCSTAGDPQLRPDDDAQCADADAPGPTAPDTPAERPRRPVQDLMRPYYGEHCCWRSDWQLFRSSCLYPIAHLIVYDMHAAQHFPYDEFYLWLSYGNGERAACLHASAWMHRTERHMLTGPDTCVRHLKPIDTGSHACAAQTASCRRRTRASSSGASSASRWTATSSCATSPSRWEMRFCIPVKLQHTLRAPFGTN